MNKNVKTALVCVASAFTIAGICWSHIRLLKQFNIIDDLKTQINDQNSSQEELKTLVDTLKEQIETLQTEVATLTNDSESLEEEISTLQSTIEDLESSQLLDEEKIEELTEKISKLEEEVKILEVTWDGKTIDTEWYDSSKDSFELSNGDQLAGLASLVADGETFEDKKIELTDDVYLGGQEWTPIESFEGEFDGEGHVINELCAYSNAPEGSSDYSYNAMFKSLTDATVTNVVFDSVQLTPYHNVYDETPDSAGYMPYEGEKGIIAGQTHGNVVISNITLRNTFVTTYNNSVGGIVAEVRDGTTTITNIDIDDSNTFQAFWGTYDGPVGGLVGLVKNGAKVVLDNINMAGVIDVYNDACANYQYFQYRYAGMLLSCVEGLTNENYQDIITATNVTVTFNSWNQYRYCEYESCGKPSGAAQGEYKYSRINNPDGSWNNGDPETHVHTANEDNHNVLLPFFNIYGFDGVGGILPKAANLVEVGDHYEDTSSIEGVKIVYLNGSETGLE